MRRTDRPGGQGQARRTRRQVPVTAHGRTTDATPAFSALVESCRVAPPQAAVVLGSGLAAVAQRLERAQTLSFLEVPGLTPTSVAGHNGCLTVGCWAGKRVLVFEGRLHYYEGHPWRGVLRPVRTAAFLHVPVLLLTNSAGGIHDALTPGSLMAIRDHIDWTRPYCWRRPGPGAVGPVRPSAYSPHLLSLLARAADGLGLGLMHGVYACVTGPAYETPAEIRALRQWGADAVGMSTVREVQAGFDSGMQCAAVSCITNRAAGLNAGPINHEEVLKTAAEQADRLADLLERLLQLI